MTAIVLARHLLAVAATLLQMATTLVVMAPQPAAIVLVTTTVAALLHPAMITTPATGATAPHLVAPRAVLPLTIHTPRLAEVVIAMTRTLLLLLVVVMRIIRMQQTGMIGQERGPHLGAMDMMSVRRVTGDSSFLPTGDGVGRASKAYRVRTSIDPALSITDVRCS